jgi:hypothetical protein
VYTRQQVSQTKQAFWTSFGQYMSPVPSAEGTKINWINYKTGVKGIRFLMDADQRSAEIAIVVAHPDATQQAMLFKKLQQLKRFLDAETEEAWKWDEKMRDENGNVWSRVHTTIHDVNLFDEKDWPAIISFFKPRIIALDAFWALAKDLIIE